MRKLLLCAWLLLPVAAAGYHFGPGQTLLRADRASEAAARAERLAAQARAVAESEGDLAARPLWSDAVDAFSEAIALLPRERAHASRALRLERAKAWMFVSRLPDARRELEGLVAELAADPGADAGQLAAAREALAGARYYVTWLMRLEGAPREEWEPEIEGSRQTYKLLAVQADARGDAELARRLREDLESAVRLARMDLTELQGLPLPSQ